jgi:glycosyltransferase involved in cell wall biosynthesis
LLLSVIIPVYNEEPTVREVVGRVLDCGVAEIEVVVVDDSSTDATWQCLQAFDDDPRVVKLRHGRNAGKGAAIRTAQPHVRGDVVVIQDADLEYDPAELPRLLRPIEQDLADVVYGSRYSGSEILVDSFWHYMGNRVLTTFSNILSNLHLTDMETCYKMMRANIFRDLELECRRFGIEPELTAKLARRGCRIYEIPISYRARRSDQGKKIGWRDGLAALWYILRFNLKP